MRIFDYLFFRLYSFYFTKEKNGSPVFTSILYLSFIQVVVTYLVVAIYFVTTQDYFGILDSLRSNKVQTKAVAIVFLLLLELFNYIRYRKANREKLLNRYRSNKLNQSLKVWMLIPAVGFMIILPFILSKMINFLK